MMITSMCLQGRSFASTAAVLAVVLCHFTSAHAAVVIDFEEYTPFVNTLLLPDSITTKDFDFDVVAGKLYVAPDSQQNVPDTGSVTFLVTDVTNSSVLLTHTEGKPFNLLGLLAAEGRNTNTVYFPVYSATSIRLDGTYANGGTVTRTLVLDQFAEENDSLDFQRFTPSGMENLVSLQFTGLGGGAVQNGYPAIDGYAFTLDDIELAVVPEPAGVAMLAGLASLAGLRRRREKGATR